MLSLLSVAAQLRMRYSLVRFACAVITDVVMISVDSAKVDWYIAVFAFASLFFCQCIVLAAGRVSEDRTRADFALQLAISSAFEDARKLLVDLFPPHIVRALIAGEDVPHVVSDGSVILYCDLAGFTRMSSGMAPLAVLHAMNAVYTAFDALVEEAAGPGGDLWKVETVRRNA
jgi:hypothetical protein